MTLNEAFASAVAKRINGDKEHGWGVDDSMAAIAATLECEHDDPASDEVLEIIKRVVNPSQFRQMLETAGKLNKSEKKAKRSAAFMDLIK